MTPERWQQVKGLFQAALARDAGERDAFLDQACVGDPLLRRHIEALLASDAQAAADFLEGPSKVPGGDGDPFRVDAFGV